MTRQSQCLCPGVHRGLRCDGGVLGRKIYLLGDPALHAGGDAAVYDAQPSQLPGRARMFFGVSFSRPGLPVSAGRRGSECSGKRSWRVAALGGYSLPQRYRYGTGSRPRSRQARDRAGRERWLTVIVNCRTVALLHSSDLSSTGDGRNALTTSGNEYLA